MVKNYDILFVSSGATADIVTVRAGTSTVQTGGTLVNAKRIIIHPQYNRRNLDKDAALINLDSPLPLNGGSIRVARLINSGAIVLPGRLLTASGWGYIRVSVIKI